MARLRVRTLADRLHEAWAAFRAERDRRLAASDWVVARAYERGEPVPPEWAAYRQALRDLPGQLTDEQVLAGEIPWPQLPTNEQSS
ncbi:MULTISPECIES: phage tail assembly chaperone [Thermus]|uniref:phage tail assembly chaperone n=1 Tax=Thermus TaxID=270 RepID=UPI002FE8853A